MTNRTRAPRLTRDFTTLCSTALFLLTLPHPAQAANLWDGGAADDNWGSATNWDDNAVPLFPAALTFGGNTRLSPSNDLSGVTVSGLTFEAGAGAFTLTGNPITLSGNVAINGGGSVTNNQSVKLPLVLGANTVLTAAPYGDISANNKGALVLNGDISGPFGVTTSGRNYVQLNGTNTYTGGTLITSLSGDPYVSIGSDRAFGTGLVTFGPTVGSGQLWAVSSGGDHTVTNDVDIKTALFVAHSASVAGKNPGSLTLSGNILVHGSSAFYMNASYLTLSGPISGGSTAASTFELRSGKLNLWGNNTFTNTLIITNPGYGNARTLNINSDASLGHTNNGVRLQTTSATIQLPSATTVALAPSRMINLTSNYVATFDIPSGSSLTVNGPITNSGSVAKSNSGTLVLAGANSYSGGTKINGGTLSTTADASLGALPASPQTNLTFASSATLGAGASHTLAANRTIAIGTNVTATFNPQTYTQTVCGAISGAPGSWLIKSGEGTLALTPDSDKTNIVSSLRMQAGTLFLAGGTTLVTSNTVWNQYKVYDILHLNGGTLLVGDGLLMTSGDGYACTQNGALVVTNGTVDLNSLRELLNAYSGTGSTTVSGSGVLDLKVLRITQSGTPHDQNVINVNTGGTIRLNNFSIDTGQAAPYGTVNLNGGTLVAKTSTDGFMGYNVPAWTTNVFFYVRTGGAVIDSGTNTISVQSPLYSGSPDDGGLTKKGPGLLTLANTNTFSGLTTVEAGTLRLGTANTLLPGNSVLVGSNGVFDVNGKALTLAGLGGSGLVTNNSLLAVTAEIEPGGPLAAGQLTLASAPASLAGTLRVDVAANGVGDRLHVQGNLNLTGLALELANPGDLEKHAQYVIASCSGALTGPFQSAALPPRWHLTYLAAGGEVRLCYNFGTLISVR